jgi:hypothetical protein
MFRYPYGHPYNDQNTAHQSVGLDTPRSRIEAVYTSMKNSAFRPLRKIASIRSEWQKLPYRQWDVDDLEANSERQELARCTYNLVDVGHDLRSMYSKNPDPVSGYTQE